MRVGSVTVRADNRKQQYLAILAALCIIHHERTPFDAIERPNMHETGFESNVDRTRGMDQRLLILRLLSHPPVIVRL